MLCHSTGDSPTLSLLDLLKTVLFGLLIFLRFITATSMRQQYVLLKSFQCIFIKSSLSLMKSIFFLDLYECESFSTLLISSLYVLFFIWFVYACPFLALSPFVSSVNSLWCCGGLVCSSVALQLAILIGFLFYSEVVKKTHRPSQAALDILIGKQQRKVLTLQIHEG